MVPALRTLNIRTVFFRMRATPSGKPGFFLPQIETMG
jgi:hypothetical protein